MFGSKTTVLSHLKKNSYTELILQITTTSYLHLNSFFEIIPLVRLRDSDMKLALLNYTNKSVAYSATVVEQPPA